LIDPERVPVRRIRTGPPDAINRNSVSGSVRIPPNKKKLILAVIFQKESL